MVSFSKAFISTILFIGGSFFIPGQAGAGDSSVQAPFNAGEIIERVSHYPRIDRGKLVRDRGIETRRFTSSFLEQRTSAWFPAGEFLLDTTVLYGPAHGPWGPISIAFGGTNYLVVWQDGRGVDFDIWGARVSPDGVLLDPAGILVSTYSGWDQEAPAVAFDGTNYLVVWQEVRTRSAWDIYGTRVSPRGAVLDSVGFQISSGNGDKVAPKVTWNGTNSLVIWQDMRNSNWDIYGARVTPGGAVLDTGGIGIATTWDRQWYPSVASDGVNYFVVYEEGDDIYGNLVSSAGVVRDSFGFPVGAAANRQSYPALSFGGSEYLVAWCDKRNGTQTKLFGARVDGNGVVLDTTGIPITPWDIYPFESPAVTFDGSNFLVVLNGGYNIYGARVGPSGVVLDPDGRTVTSGSWNKGGAVAAFGRDYYLIVWGAESNAFCARMLPDGSVLDPIPYNISTAATKQEHPAVASNGTNYLAVWEQEAWPEGSSIDIFGERIDTNGVTLDPKPIPIAADAGYPSVTSDGTDYLVAWEDARGGIFGTRVTSGGIVLDSVGISIFRAPWPLLAPAVASDGSNYLVAWIDGRGNDSAGVYCARVTPTGVVLDTSGIWVPDTRGAGPPAVAFDGANYLIVWSGVRGARISPSGVVLDTSGIAISAGDFPKIAFDGTNYLVVYVINNVDIYGSRVSPDGVVIDPDGFPIHADQSWTQQNPVVAFDGTNYTVTWEDCNPWEWSYFDLHGAKVRPSGVVIDSFPVSLQPKHQTSPVLVHGPGSQVLVAYSGYADSAHHHPTVTQRIWGKFNPGTSGVQTEEGIRPSGSSIRILVYPNPFREKAWVSTNVPGRLKVYDALGRLVREFPKEAAKPGPLAWDGRDERGRRLPGGVYFLRFEHGAGCETRKAVLVR